MKILGHFYNMVYLFLAESDLFCLGGLILAFSFAKNLFNAVAPYFSMNSADSHVSSHPSSFNSLHLIRYSLLRLNNFLIVKNYKTVNLPSTLDVQNFSNVILSVFIWTFIGYQYRMVRVYRILLGLFMSLPWINFGRYLTNFSFFRTSFRFRCFLSLFWLFAQK